MKLIYVCGDSHRWMFQERFRQEPGPLFPEKTTDQIKFVDGVKMRTAYASRDLDDEIRSFINARRWAKEDEIWFVLGEIDVRWHIFYQHQKNGTSIAEEIDKVVDSYTDYIFDLRRLWQEIKVCGIVPPQREPKQHIMRGEGMIPEDRRDIARMLNARLQEACRIKGIPFLDIYSLLVGQDGYNREEMTRDGMHYNYCGDIFINAFCREESR